MKPYLDEYWDDRYVVGIGGYDDFLVERISAWCDNFLSGAEGESWGFMSDEFYSYTSSGAILWLAHEEDYFTFKLAHCQD